MSERVLTTASTITCFHGQGVTLASTATMRVGGAPVVRLVDLTQTVFQCTFDSKCALFKVFQTSALMRDGGSPAVLATGLETNIGPCQQIDAGHALLQTE